MTARESIVTAFCAGIGLVVCLLAIWGMVP